MRIGDDHIKTSMSYVIDSGKHSCILFHGKMREKKN